LPSTEMRNIAPRSSMWMDASALPGPRNREIRCSRGTSVTSSCQMASGRGQRLAPTTGSASPGRAVPLLSFAGVPTAPCPSPAACARPPIARSTAAMTHCRRYRHTRTHRRYPNPASWIVLFRRSIAGTSQLLHEAITSHAPYRG
jgi:hypothetical protein